MKQYLVQLFLVQAYWLSLVFIGWMAASALARRFKLEEAWRQLPILGRFFLAVALACALFGALAVVGYLLQLPIVIVVVCYGLFLALACYSLVFHHKITVTSWLRRLPVCAIILAFVLLADFLLSLWIGGFLGGDAIVHISKIRYIVEHGFTLTDAYFGTAPETRHHVSLTHVLYVVPTYFGLEAYQVWSASQAFFRLLEWSALFFFAWALLRRFDRSVRTNLACFVTIGGLLLLSDSYTAQYPTTYAACWLVISIVGLLGLVRGQVVAGWLLLLGSFLVALTHPLMAIANGILLALVGLGILLCARKLVTKLLIAFMATAVAILLTTPLFTQLLPNQMTEQAKNYGMSRYEFYQVGEWIARLPVWPKDIVGWLVMVAAFIGGYCFFSLAQRRGERIVIMCVGLFAALVVFNPFVYTPLSLVLPAWGINRLANVAEFFSVLAASMALFFVAKCLLVVHRAKGNHDVKALYIAAVMLCLAAPFVQSFNRASWAKDVTIKSINQTSKVALGAYHELVKEVPPETIVFAERGDAFFMPAVAPVRVVAIAEASATPAADMVNRTRCYNALVKDLEPGLLRKAEVKYIVARADSRLESQAIRVATFEKRIDYERGALVLYKVNPSSEAIPATSLCTFND